MDDSTISVSLSEERRQFIADEMAAGNYADAAEVVEAALGLLETRNKIGSLRALIAEGDADIAAGRVFGYQSTADLLKDLTSGEIDH